MAWGNNNGWNTKKPEQEDTEEDRELGWDDESYTCEEAPEYILLEPGKYEFKVKSFERGRYNGSDDGTKIPCPMAKITLAIETPQGDAIVHENLYLRVKLKWRIDNFFRALGMAKPGEKYKPDWQKAVGQTGFCEIENREYNKNKYNQVKRYYYPDEEQ